jgi:SAM-dependent methyltransferase
MHHIAEEGFDKEATTYERSRPTYPREAVAWVSERLQLAVGVRCADIAAGTGILTRLLVDCGCDLVAVEPVAGMRATMRTILPELPTVSAVAEALPFRDGSLDAVTVAQAFHWFDAPRALAEISRTLRVGGAVAMLWNARDRSRDWVDQVWSVMDRVEKHAPWRDHDHVAGPDSAHARRDDDFTDAPGFGQLASASFTHEQTLTPEGVVERIRGVSHVAVLATAQQRAVLDEVRAILQTHVETRGRDYVTIPYRVDCYALTRAH